MSKYKGNQEEKRFVNPYNFVSLDAKCERTEPENGNFTGYFTCTLTTKSPLFIPNSETVGDNDKTQEFFSYEYSKEHAETKSSHYKPTIPGSEIKGMVRSVHEAAFNGCLSQINMDKPIHKRSMEPKKAGLLSFDKNSNQFFIQPCERVMLNVTKGNKFGKVFKKTSFTEGSTIFIERSQYPYKNDRRMPYYVDDVSEIKGSMYERGYVHIGEPFGKKKHHESVFVVEKHLNKKSVSTEEIERLIKVLENYNNEKINLNKEKGMHSGYTKFMICESVNEIPVYYSTTNDEFTHLSLAMLSQEASLKTIRELIEHHGGYQPCKCKNNLCRSCALFGFVSEKAGKASKVRFGDASINPSHNEYYEEPVRILLGEPRFNTTEFYTEINEKYSNNRLWTYDYVQLEKRKRTTLNKDDIKIRGRKFYWHGANIPASIKESTDMTRKIRPLKTNSDFTLKVYFEQLTKEELQQLQWSLDFNNEENGHKLGQGKPLGYGSVQIKLEKLVLREINYEDGQWRLNEYTSSEEGGVGNWVELDKGEDLELKLPDDMSTPRKELLEITKLEQPFNGEISYPKAETNAGGNSVNDKASHQWFTINRKNAKKRETTNITFYCRRGQWKRNY